MPGRFIKSEVTSSNGSVFEMQHRYEDRALICDVIRDFKPLRSIELGTAKGGFAALLAGLTGEWKGSVITIDKTPEPGIKAKLEAAYENVVVIVDDVLVESKPSPGPGWPFWKHLLTRPRSFLYCDNGNKMRELELYAPVMGPMGLVGTHDYATEVDPAWVEPFLAGLGYLKVRHDEFAALADPVDYPASLTRFWMRPGTPDYVVSA